MQHAGNSMTSIIKPENIYLTCKYSLKTSNKFTSFGLIFGNLKKFTKRCLKTWGSGGEEVFQISDLKERHIFKGMLEVPIPTILYCSLSIIARFECLSNIDTLKPSVFAT